MNKVVRLSEEQIKAIKEIAKDIFGPRCKVYLFGSRTDLNKKGGDIDLYIIPGKRNIDRFSAKLDFLVKLKMAIGEQRIDVILAKDPKRDIEKSARSTGVEL